MQDGLETQFRAGNKLQGRKRGWAIGGVALKKMERTARSISGIETDRS